MYAWILEDLGECVHGGILVIHTSYFSQQLPSPAALRSYFHYY